MARTIPTTTLMAIVGVLLFALLAETGDNGKPLLDNFGDPLPKGAFARLGTVRWRGGGHIRGLAFSPDDQFLASGAVDDTVRIWEAGSGKELKRLSGHKPLVTSIAYSPDGSMLVSAGADNVIRLRDVKSGKEIRSFRGHKGLLSCVTFSPNGETLASAGDEKRGDVRVWNAKTGDLIHQLPHKAPVQSLAYAPNSKTILSGSIDGMVRLWDVGTGMERRQFDGKFENARWIRVAFSPKEDWIAAGGGAREPKIVIWNVENGKLLHRLEGHTHFFMTALTFSPDGKILASGSLNYEMGNSSVFLWDAATGKEIRRINQPKHGVSSLAFSQSGKILAAGANSTIHRWNVEDGKELNPREAHDEIVMAVHFSPDGQRVATGAYDGLVRIWDARTGKHLRKLEEHSSGVPFLAFAAGGKQLVHSGKHVSVNDADTGKEIRKFVLPENTYAVALSPDGQLLLTSKSADGTMQIWEISKSKEVARLEKSRFRRAFFSPDGKTIALGGDGTIQLWDWSTQKAIRSFSPYAGDIHPAPEVRMAAFSADGSKLAVLLGISNSASVWDVTTGKEIRRFPEAEHEIFALAMSSDGNLVAVGNWDKSIRVYETATGKQRAHFIGQEGSINVLGFSHDGGTLASGSQDSTVLLWKLPAGR